MIEARAVRKKWDEEGKDCHEEMIQVLDARIEKGKVILERLNARIENGKVVFERLGGKNGAGYLEEVKRKIREVVNERVVLVWVFLLAGVFVGCMCLWLKGA